MKRGFTLIELLVVISIIGLLSSIVLASLNTAREKAEIAKISSEMKSIQLALELYYDAYNQYPNAGGLINWYDIYTFTDGLTSLVTDNLIPSFPAWDQNKFDYFYVAGDFATNDPGYGGGIPRATGGYILIIKELNNSSVFPFPELINGGGDTEPGYYCISS
jgi:prepilin-type N-terminal cleavage/methylation domain-containing protein